MKRKHRKVNELIVIWQMIVVVVNLSICQRTRCMNYVRRHDFGMKTDIQQILRIAEPRKHACVIEESNCSQTRIELIVFRKRVWLRCVEERSFFFFEGCGFSAERTARQESVKVKINKIEN